MKLAQIQEARSHHNHPIVAWIKNFVKKSEVGDHSSYRLISKKQAHVAADAITREFGDQITVADWPVTEWNIDIEENKIVHLQVDYKNKTVDVHRMRFNY